MSAYYNEFDPYAAQWLRNLIAAGHIAQGEVDERSVVDVEASDLRGFDQCHFFAGIGVWSYALRLAGWPDDRPVWTASLPCQPFSAAGKRQGHADERHLAPVWLRLVEECRPPVCLGEQVGAAIGMGWLDALFIRLEQLGYAAGAVDFPAASVGAPHIRQRVYWVADTTEQRCRKARDTFIGQAQRDSGGCPTDGVAESESERQRSVPSGRHSGSGIVMAGPESRGDGGDDSPTDGVADSQRWTAERHGYELGSSPGGVPREARQQRIRPDAWHGEPTDGVADAAGDRATGHSREEGGAWEPRRTEPRGGGILGDTELSQRRPQAEGRVNVRNRNDAGWQEAPGGLGVARPTGDMGDAIDARPQGRERSGDLELHRGAGADGSAPTAGFWADAEWLFCRDGKARPTEPGTFPLAHGATQRVGRLRAYGNCIVAPQAAEFIRAAMT